jgi:superfamily II DNA/RNA helicase
MKGNLFLGHVTHVVIDEVDTMLTQGFGEDIRYIYMRFYLLDPDMI